MQEIAQKIRSFVIDNFLFGEADDHFSSDDSFFENLISKQKPETEQ